MIGQNNYNVDAVSGATLSSEAIKSAVSKALKKGYLD
ncbi:MAG: FMN-binding protein [Mobilitalea sp.]